MTRTGQWFKKKQKNNDERLIGLIHSVMMLHVIQPLIFLKGALRLMMQGSDHHVSKMHNRDGNDRHTYLQFIFDRNMFKQHSKPLLSLSVMRFSSAAKVEVG